MGIFCDINLFKPSDGAYHPGQAVTGVIKYAVDEPLQLESITISLKGLGDLLVEERKKENEKDTRRSSEVYVDEDLVVQDTKVELPVGAYDAKFNFYLPPNIPSSLEVYKSLGRYSAECIIKYYIRIKFKKSALFSFNKHFKKEITVASERLTPTLLREPVIYGELKRLMSFFSRKNNIVNIKGSILNSVIPIGGKIEVNYEVENDSNVLIKSIETKLVEKYKFITTGRDVEIEDDVFGTDAKMRSIKSGCKESIPTEINVPYDRHSLENSKIVSRHYVVRLTAALPMPHINAVLNIPVQIGTINEEWFTDMYQEINYDDPPPSYWEAMGEVEKHDKK